MAEGWVEGPAADKGDRWDPAELGKVVPDLVAKAAGERQHGREAEAEVSERRGLGLIDPSGDI